MHCNPFKSLTNLGTNLIQVLRSNKIHEGLNEIQNWKNIALTFGVTALELSKQFPPMLRTLRTPHYIVQCDSRD